MHRLKGHTIREFNLDDEGYTFTIVTDKSTFVFQAEGDCCANAYIIAPERNDVACIIDQKVIEVSTSGFDSEETYYGQTDTEFYSIKTQFADLDLELRTEHNGYYCGWIEFVSETPHESV